MKEKMYIGKSLTERISSKGIRGCQRGYVF